MELILDIGSGRSLHNVERAKKMMDAVAAMDSHKHTIIWKAQLFITAKPNIPLDHDVFQELYHYAGKLGYKMTASVFDLHSLDTLLEFEVPFVKIACRPDLYWLIGEVPRKVDVYASIPDSDTWPEGADEVLSCVSEYPAKVETYYERFDDHFIGWVSDHTVGWELLRRVNPDVIEKHLCYERDPDNPDSGPFAVTPEELREVL